jgi:DNA-binding CsgD family transcriptional regulator
MPKDTHDWNVFNLTDQEIKIVWAMVSSDSEQIVARKLSISRGALKHHLTDVFHKLGVQNRLELILFVTYHIIAKSSPNYMASK